MWNWIRKHQTLLCLLLVNLVLRVPRGPNILGDDTFVVVSLARMLNDGYFENWTMSVFSLVGLYPFVSYSIGLPLIVALMFSFGFSIESTAIILSITTTVVGTVGSYYLGSDLFDKPEDILIFSFFYSIGGYFFYQMTYYTIHPRGVFLAIMPWFLLMSLRYLRIRRTNNLTKAIGLFILLLLTHQIAVFLLVYAGIFILYKLVHHVIEDLMRTNQVSGSIISRRISFLLRWWHERTESVQHQILWVTFLLISSVSYILGLLIISPFIGFNLSFETFLDSSIFLGKYFGIRIGIMCFLVPFGVLSAFRRGIDDKQRIIHFVLIPVILFLLPTEVYALLLFFPVFGYYSVLGFDAVRRMLPRAWVGVGPLMLVFTIGLAYSLPISNLVLALSPFLIVFFTIISVGWFYRNRSVSHASAESTKRFGVLVLLSAMIVFSLMFSDSVASSTMRFSDDESAIIEYLNEQPNPGIAFVYSHRVGRRLEGYGFSAVMSFNEDVSLYYGWIDSATVISNTELDFISLLRSGKLFSYMGQSPEWLLWGSVVTLDLTNITQYMLAKEIGFEYVIVEKSGTGYSDILTLRTGLVVSPCTLLATAPLACELVIEGSIMSLFRLA